MNKLYNKSNKRKMLRFRKWSRKAYAAFCSVGKCVTIGYISTNIADASLRKQTRILALAPGTSHSLRNGYPHNDGGEDTLEDVFTLRREVWLQWETAFSFSYSYSIPWERDRIRLDFSNYNLAG